MLGGSYFKLKVRIIIRSENASLKNAFLHFKSRSTLPPTVGLHFYCKNKQMRKRPFQWCAACRGGRKGERLKSCDSSPRMGLQLFTCGVVAVSVLIQRLPGMLCTQDPMRITRSALKQLNVGVESGGNHWIVQQNRTLLLRLV